MIFLVHGGWRTLLLGVSLAGMGMLHAHAQTSTPASGEPPAVVHHTQPAGNNDFALSALPAAIEALPTLLPQESSQKMVPDQQDTRDLSSSDRRHARVRHFLQRQAIHMDHWFGQPDPELPATASLRVLLDSTWNEYDDFKIKPRVRGKIRLPTLEKRFSLVFGDDSLDDEIRNTVAISNRQAFGRPNKTLDRDTARRENNSLAIRWSNLLKHHAVDADIDLGLRSGVKDAYVRVKAARDWQLQDNFSSRAEQIYRYGSDSEHYLRTNLEIRHHADGKPFIADQAALTYADDNKAIGVAWENRLFRQHAFFHDNTFSYGIYSGGSSKAIDMQGNKKGLNLNSYGPFVSWRQPFLRDWFFVQGDINYFNDQLLDRSHFVSGFLRLETVF